MSSNVSNLTEDILVERLGHKRLHVEFLPPLESTDQHLVRFGYGDIEVPARECLGISGGGRV